MGLDKGEAFGEAARERRHGRPLDVIPLQVVAAFLESDRGRRDSGVPRWKGMFEGSGGG